MDNHDRENDNTIFRTEYNGLMLAMLLSPQKEAAAQAKCGPIPDSRCH
jgi:hypothetical protein